MSIIAAATAGSGPIAIITAIGGVVVSLTTVYFNNRRQTVETKTHADQITALTSQITSLGAQVLELKGENAKLTLELRLVKEGLDNRPKKRRG